jgi:hypothetical protein
VIVFSYGDVVMVLSTVLRIKPTLDRAQTEKLISNAQARKALAVERIGRADWRKRELAVNSLETERDHVNDASMPHLAPDREWQSASSDGSVDVPGLMILKAPAHPLPGPSSLRTDARSRLSADDLSQSPRSAPSASTILLTSSSGSKVWRQVSGP